MESITDVLNDTFVAFSHDGFGNLASATYNDEHWDYKLPDAIGNLFKTKEKKDRSYGKAGQLLKDEKYSYNYDRLGNLIQKESLTEKWEYNWTNQGRLSSVIRPNKEVVAFTYDALGRRISKSYQEETTHFIWDGNVPIHEWKTPSEATNTIVNETGDVVHKIPEDLITWVFEEGSFIPQAKLQNGKSYSIITDHLVTPTLTYYQNCKKYGVVSWIFTGKFLIL